MLPRSRQEKSIVMRPQTNRNFWHVLGRNQWSSARSSHSIGFEPPFYREILRIFPDKRGLSEHYYGVCWWGRSESKNKRDGVFLERISIFFLYNQTK